MLFWQNSLMYFVDVAISHQILEENQEKPEMQNDPYKPCILLVLLLMHTNAETSSYGSSLLVSQFEDFGLYVFEPSRPLNWNVLIHLNNSIPAQKSIFLVEQ